MKGFKFLFFLLFAFSFSSLAGVGLNQTRIIINESDNVSSVTTQSGADTIYLVVNYITEKLDSQVPTKDLFIITPSIFKIGPNQKNIIKIKAIGSKFPKNQESLYYFHSRGVPESDSPNTKGMKVGLENVIKLLYRPSKLSMSQDDAFKGLNVKSTPDGIKLVNNSPYYINLTYLAVNKNKIDLNKKNNIVAPFSEVSYTSKIKHGSVKWVIINDLGGYNEYQGTVE